MPTNSHNIAKQVRYKVESTWNTAPGASGAQLLRRITFVPKLAKGLSESGELVSHRQRTGTRHGVRQSDASLAGQLSPGTYKDFMAACVRKAFAAVSSIASLSLTVASATAPHTITRGSGSWLSDGIKIGMVVRLTAGSLNAANLNKNLMVVSVTSTVLTVVPLNGVVMVAEGPIASCTLAVTGKVTYAPTTGHTDLSYSFEDWQVDSSQSELFTGLKVNEFGIAVPDDGNVGFTMGLVGADITTAASAYFSSPTAETTAGICHSADGIIVASTGEIAYITGATLSVKGNMQIDKVVGSNSIVSVNPGQILVDGQLTAFFPDRTLSDYFLNETQVAVMFALATSSAAAADFVGFAMPLCKLNSADKDDGDKSQVRTFSFTSDYNASGGSGVQSEQTSLQIQDSLA